MDLNVVESVVDYSSKGCKILFGHNVLGGMKIKVKYGPFKILTKRFKTDIETYYEVKRRLKAQNSLL